MVSLSLTVLVAVASAVPNGRSSGPSSAPELAKRQMGNYRVTGVQVAPYANVSLPSRLEIRELQKNADQWNLYLLGLERFQSTEQDEMLSWYQIAGASRPSPSATFSAEDCHADASDALQVSTVAPLSTGTAPRPSRAKRTAAIALIGRLSFRPGIAHISPSTRYRALLHSPLCAFARLRLGAPADFVAARPM